MAASDLSSEDVTLEIPKQVRDVMARPEFWASYFWEDDNWFWDKSHDLAPSDPPECGQLDADSAARIWDVPIEFPLGDASTLILRVSQDFSYLSLSLATPSFVEPPIVAWDDTSHWHPHVLRWEELELIGRLAALSDSRLQHPGVPLLLLARFAPIVDEVTADLAFPMSEAAWRAVRCPESLVDVRTGQFDRRGKGINWRFDEASGWTLNQSDEASTAAGFSLYTVRSPDGSEFPIAEWRIAFESALDHYRSSIESQWLSQDVKQIASSIASTGNITEAPRLADALEASGCRHLTIIESLRSSEPCQVCWVVELICGTEIGAVVRRHFGPTRFRHRPETRLVLFTPEPMDRHHAGLPTISSEIAESLNAELKRNEAGIAKEGFGTGAYEGGIIVGITGKVDITLRGEIAPALTLTRRTLAQLNLPASSLLRICDPHWRTISLVDENEM